MFLSNEELNGIQAYNQKYLTTSKEVVSDCWNSFQWVTNRLDEWASETVIGANLRENLVNLNKALELLIANTETLRKDINDFCNNQRAANAGNLK